VDRFFEPVAGPIDVELAVLDDERLPPCPPGFSNDVIVRDFAFIPAK
jgi:hypothetical protein